MTASNRHKRAFATKFQSLELVTAFYDACKLSQKDVLYERLYTHKKPPTKLSKLFQYNIFKFATVDLYIINVSLSLIHINRNIWSL